MSRDKWCFDNNHCHRSQFPVVTWTASS